jgi:hypothetical protein
MAPMTGTVKIRGLQCKICTNTGPLATVNNNGAQNRRKNRSERESIAITRNLPYERVLGQSISVVSIGPGIDLSIFWFPRETLSGCEMDS